MWFPEFRDAHSNSCINNVREMNWKYSKRSEIDSKWPSYISHEWCKMWMWMMLTLTHFNLRKCKLNARNEIDNMMPIRASVDTMKNAIGDTVATRSLKILFAIGTCIFFHLMGTHFWHSKSKCSFDGWNSATDCSRPSCTWLKTEMPMRSAPLKLTGPCWCQTKGREREGEKERAGEK